MKDFFQVVRRWTSTVQTVFTGRADLWHITTAGLDAQTLGRDGAWLFQTVEADALSWKITTAEAVTPWSINTLEVHT